MNSILARTACLALGLGVLELLSGCASSRSRGAPGDELNPVVSCEPHFTGFKSGQWVILDIEVEQKDPMIMRPHTWAVHVWARGSSTNDVTPASVAWMMEKPPQVCMPDLRAGKEEVELRYWDNNTGSGSKYCIVVVEVIEMTGGARSSPYASKLYSVALERGGHYKGEVAIPPCIEEAAPAAAAEVEVEMEFAVPAKG